MSACFVQKLNTMSFTEKIKSIPDKSWITISVILIIGFIIFSFIYNINLFVRISSTSLDFLDAEHTERIELTKAAASDSLSAEKVEILLKKITILENSKSHHLDLIKTLSKNKYSLLTLLPITSAITAILVFLILQKGWSNSNIYIKTYFILFTTITSLIGIYPEVYKQTESITKHTESYMKYDKLQKSIFSYSLTAPLLEKDSIGFVEFIDKVNTEERKLTTLIFDLEKKSLDKEMFNSINGK